MSDFCVPSRNVSNFSLIQLNDFEKYVTEMNNDPVNPVNNIFNKVEEIIEYCDMKNCCYYQPQLILKAYNIINNTGKLREYINSWNRLPPIHKTWIAFKFFCCKSHLEQTKTGELTLKQAGYRQTNLVEDILNHLYAEFQHKENMVNSVLPKDPSPPIATGTADIMQQVLDQNQEMMRLL